MAAPTSNSISHWAAQPILSHNRAASRASPQRAQVHNVVGHQCSLRIRLFSARVISSEARSRAASPSSLITQHRRIHLPRIAPRTPQYRQANCQIGTESKTESIYDQSSQATQLATATAGLSGQKDASKGVPDYSKRRRYSAYFPASSSARSSHSSSATASQS